MTWTQEDAYRSYDCVRKEFPDFANFEDCPWVETVNRTWIRSNTGYLLEVTPTQVTVRGPTYEHIWSVYKLSKDDLRTAIENSLSEAPIG